MLNANGSIAEEIEVYASKTKSRRKIPMHEEVHDALVMLLEKHPDATHAAFSIGRDGALRRQSASCVANWFFRLYRSAGLIGCSSHSGRRTFATGIARLLGGGRGSLADLQRLLGHVNLASTECYLEPSDRVAELVRSLGK
jgi:integrase/recombinase XerD